MTQPQKSALTRARETVGISARHVARAIKMDPSGLARVERGDNLPNRETARALFKFYRGAVPLGVIYDPRHKTSQAWFTNGGRTDLAIYAGDNVKVDRRPRRQARRLAKAAPKRGSKSRS